MEMGGQNPSMSKITENVMVKELKYKDLAPPGPRRVLLYLGDDNFKDYFKDMGKLQRDKLEEINKAKRLK